MDVFHLQSDAVFHGTAKLVLGAVSALAGQRCLDSFTQQWAMCRPVTWVAVGLGGDLALQLTPCIGAASFLDPTAASAQSGEPI